MEFIEIQKNIFFRQSNSNSNEKYIEFKVYQPILERANLISFQIGIIGTFGIFFLCFLYQTIDSIIGLFTRYSKDYGITIMNLIFLLIIILTIIWAKFKLKKTPKYEDVKITKKDSYLIISGSNYINPVKIDLKNIKGAWINEEYSNNILIMMFIQLSTEVGGTNIKDQSSVIFILLNLSNLEKLKEIYYFILLFIEENFKEISIGYDNNYLEKKKFYNLIREKN